MNPFDKLGLAEIRASELKTCIYCSTLLPAKSKEHLFSACCGGTHKSSQLICDSCNHAFSSLDPALTQYASFVMNAWGFKGDRHGDVPVIPLDGDYELAPFATPRLKTAKLSATPLADGGYSVKVVARTKNEARRLLLDGDGLAQRVGHDLTEVQREAIRENIRVAQKTQGEVGTSTYKATFRFNDEFRLAAHTILKCAVLYDPDLVRHDITKPIRDFARYDIGKVEEFAVVTKENLSPFPEIQRALGVLQNTVLIYWSKTERKIIGIFHLLGRLQRSIILAEEYSGPDAFLCLYEAVRGNPQPKAMFAQLGAQVTPVPLIEITGRPPAIKSLVEDFARLTQECMVDAIQARLLGELQRLTSPMPLTLDHVAAITDAIAVALTEYARASGQQLSKEDARSILAGSGANAGIIACIGQPSNAKSVEIAAANMLVMALSKIYTQTSMVNHDN